MRIRTAVISGLILIVLTLDSRAGNHRADSLLAIATGKAHDTIRFKAWYDLAWDNLYPANDTAEIYARKLVMLGKRCRQSNLLADAYHTLGAVFHVRGDFDAALENYRLSKKYNRKRDKKSKGLGTINNIGLIYSNRGQYAMAIKEFYDMLSIAEAEHDSVFMLNAYNKLGGTYRFLKDIKKSLQAYNASLAVDSGAHNKADVFMGMANVYFDCDSLEKALKFYEKTRLLAEAHQIPRVLAVIYANMGNVWFKQKNYGNALEYYTQQLKLLDKGVSLLSIANTYHSIGSCYHMQGNYGQAIRYFKQAENYARQLNSYEMNKMLYESMSKTYEESGNTASALIYYKKFIAARDSIAGADNIKAIADREAAYKYDKKALRDSIQSLEELAVRDREIANRKLEVEKGRVIQYALYGGLGLLLVFGGFMYNRFRVTRKQKKLIEQQKLEVESQKEKAEHQRELVEEKQKEILDSINYAKRLQHAILAPPEEIKRYLPKSFLLYKPKDIVAGDFYFFETTDTHLFIAAADCTGHGVPGAMVSVVCANALTRCVREFNLTDPGEILDKTRELVVETFEKSGSEVKDGMDISLAALRFEIRDSKFEMDNQEKSQTSSPKSQISNLKSQISLRWSGANNPLWVLRLATGSMEEIKANKQPIGKYADSRPFTTHKVQMQKGDTVYLFTDGYADQFGGEKGKKFKYSNMKELLIGLNEQPMEAQHGELDRAFDNWRGELEQVDDVCIIAFRV